MSEVVVFELLYSAWELGKLTAMLCIFVTLLRILRELRDLKAGDLREIRRLARGEHANEYG